MRFPFLCLAAAVGIAGCAMDVQTTSGQAYLAAYPAEFGTASPAATVEGAPVGVGSDAAFDQAVRQVAAVEPTLRFPARIGLARIEDGELSPVPEDEAAAWTDLARRLGPGFGEYVPVSPLIAEMVADPIAARGSPVRQAIQKIRLGAARQHVDVVLIYEVASTADSDRNPLSIADLTILGAFLLPGRSNEAVATATALLVDVRNGYPYGTASAFADRQALSTGAGAASARADLAERAETAAAVALTGEVEAMLLRLRDELAGPPRLYR